MVDDVHFESKADVGVAIATAGTPRDIRGSRHTLRLPGTLVPMEPTLHAERFAILTAPAACHACNAPMAVAALFVPAYVQRHEDDDEWMAVG